MLRFINWLQPPIFDDDETNRAAALLHWSLLVILISAIVVPLLLFIFQPGERAILLIIFIAADICFLTLLLLLRRGSSVQPVSWSFVTVIWIGFTIAIYKFDGVYDTAVVGYFIAIMLAALLLGRWASGLFCLLSIGSVSVAYFLQIIGVIYVEAKAQPLPIDIILLIVGLLATALLLGVAVHRITEGFTQARRSQQVLTLLNQGLEEKIAQRTRQLDQANQTLREDLAERQTITEALRISEEKYRLVVENATEAIVVAQNRKLKFFNKRLMDFTRGYTREELLSLPFVKFIHPDDRELVISRHLSRLQDPDKVMPVYSFRALDKDGQITWVEINTVQVAWEDKPAVLFFMTDITERLQAEQSLRESEARFRTLFENSPDAIVLIDPHDPKVDWPIIDCNNVFCRMNGYTQQELLGQPISIVNNSEVEPGERESYLNTIKQAKTIKQESMHRNNDGSVFPVQTSSTLINLADREIILGIDRDISAQKALEEQLHQARFNLEQKVQARTAAVAAVNTKLKVSLAEKEILLKEIHHRVKNNMQVISSLLSLQSGYITDPQALEIFRDSQYRVRSMALIHEKLYQSENLARINFSDYINDLTSVLFQTYQAHQQKIVFQLQSEKLFLELDQAIPCGLIINELVSNALKHAFPHGKGGTLTINLDSNETEQITLTVADNGVGFPHDLNFQETETLGLQLVNSLVAQLQGTISQTHNGGTEYKIRFPGAK